MNKNSLDFAGAFRAVAGLLGGLSLMLVTLAPVGASAQDGGLVTVEIAGTGEGLIVSDDGNINCPGDCSQTYFENVDVILTASPEADSVFVGWQGGGCSGTGECLVNASASPRVTAIFDLNTPDTPRTLSVSLSGQGSGSVSSNDQTINCQPDCSASYSNSETVTLTAVADSGSEFQGWQGGGCTGTGTCTVTMSNSRSVSAVFALSTGNPDRTLSVSLAGDGSGTVNSDDQAITCPDVCSATYNGTQVITLVATAADNSLFQGWQGGGCSGTGSCTVTLDQSLTVTAVFALDSGAGGDRQLQVSLAGDGGGSVTSSEGSIACPGVCEATLADGTTLALVAAAEADSVFAGWQGAGCSGTGDCSVTMNQDRSVTAVFERDGDGDGVTDSTPDLCPNTPPGTIVDAQGCGPNEGPGDDDKDSVPNDIDQCPNTPPGETVDSVGCSVTQPNPEDDDMDGVPNTIDQCPDTPPNTPVDEVGCSDNQEPADGDADGVPDTIDQCPNTPPGQPVDEVGCSETDERDDDDDDGVGNKVDACANTPAGEQADASGCSPSQTDSDGDGVADLDDSCPGTPGYVAAVDVDGCPAVVQFGNQLGSLNGLSENERRIGNRLDEICPMLVKLEDQRELTEGEGDLRDACLRLKDTRTTESQAAIALGEIALTELASLQNYMVDISTRQYRHIGARVGQLRAGAGGGVSVAGLNLRVDGQQMPDHLLQSAVDSILGGGASADDGFGKLGVFLQGDFDFGERDETALESGYEFDSWTVALGADYRFTDTLFGGVSISAGNAEVDYDRRGGEADISSWTLSVYSGWMINNNFYLDGVLSYSASDIESRRNIAYVDAGGPFDSSHLGDTDGDQIFLGLNTGYLLNRGSWRFGPTAALSYLDGTIDAFAEKSAAGTSQAWNFAVDEQDIESLRIRLGVQADYIVNTSFGVLIPGIRMDYVLEQEDGSEELGMRYVNNPFTDEELVSDRIVIRTDGRDSGFLDTNFTLSGQFIMGFSGFVSYQFYSSYDDYSRGGFSIGARWDKPF